MRRHVLAAVLATSAAARAQMPDPAKVTVKTTHVSASVSMLEGAGGNLALSTGDDGLFLVDDQYAPLAPKIQAAIAAVSKKPLRFIFNTHWHGDHTGGNEALAAGGAVIVAHDNVRRRLSVDQFIELFNKKVPASPAKALPIVTFSDGITFHLNGDTVRVVHAPAAHTDGDSLVLFERADVLHTGDTFTHGGYPLIDISSGGTIDGFLAAEERALALAGPATKIIPGHGPLATRRDLERAHAAFVRVRDAVAKAKAEGKTLEQVLAAKPTAEYDATFGGGFIKGDTFVTMVYKSLGSTGERAMRSITSKDGTAIAYEVSGSGPPLVLVHGTSADHGRWAPVLAALEKSHTVYAVDRRGRGASGDADAWALEREAEDAAAVVDAIGKPVQLVGHSFGALVALEAAQRTSHVAALALYEPPIPTAGPMVPPEKVAELEALSKKGDREGVLVTFFRDVVRMPPSDLERARSLPQWAGRVAAAHTILRELAATEAYRIDAAKLGKLKTRTLLLVGGDSPPIFRDPIAALEKALPQAKRAELPGQRHMAIDGDPDAFARAVLEFLDGKRPR